MELQRKYFRFKVPSGTCKAEVTFTGTQGVHEFHFTSHNSEARFVPWAHYDYDYNNEAFLLDLAYAKRGTHPDIVDLPFPRIQGLANFHNPTCPSHLVNGSLVKRRRMYTPNEIRPTPVQECHRRMHDGPTSFTRAQSVQGHPVNRTPPCRHVTRSLSRSRSVPPHKLQSRRSPAPRPRSGVASHSRSRSRSPHGNPPRYVSRPAWLVIRDKLSDEDFAFIKDILAYVKGERALLKFAPKCDIPDISLKWAIRNHVNSFTDAIPYDTIEQVFIVWWVKRGTFKVHHGMFCGKKTWKLCNFMHFNPFDTFHVEPTWCKSLPMYDPCRSDMVYPRCHVCCLHCNESLI